MGSGELHPAVAAVEVKAEPLSVVVQVEGTWGGVGVVPQTLPQLVAQAVFCSHEGFAVIVVGFLKPVFYLLHPVAEVELFCVGVEYVGTVVEDGFEIGGGV